MSVLTQSDPRTYQIIGAAMEVHRQWAMGLLNQCIRERWQSN